MMRALSVNSSEITGIKQLPPSVIDIVGRPAAFPLALGHSVDYVSNRAALIGFVC